MKSIFQQFHSQLVLVLFGLLAALPACVKTEFDEPPTGGSPVTIVANKTILETKALHSGALNSRVTIPDTADWILKGQVIMDDKSGNFYKTLVIQDGTAGIELKFTDGFLYTKYPIGRNVYINCRGLLLSDYNGVLSINGGTIIENGVPSVLGISSAQADKLVVKGEFEALIAPKVKKINELLTSDISTLIQLDNVEFANADANKPWADAVSQTSVNRVLEDCNQLTVLVRSSGFANFATALTPAGKGSLVGVYSVYRDDQQFYIRDTNDVQLTGPRCGVNTNLTGMSIADLRSSFANGTTSGPQDKKISGVVISDRAFLNTDPRNIVLQDGASGIVIRFSAAHTFDLGDKIDVDISGVELSEFNGLLQVNNVPANNALKIGTGTVTPRVASIAEIKQNFESWESTLVTIKGAQFAVTGTYSGSKSVLDNSGDMVHFTRTAATFSGSQLPTGTIEMTAILSQFTTPQLIVRSTADVTGGGGGGGGGGTPVATVNEAFDGVANNVAFSVSGWKNIAVKGTRTWLGKTFQTDKYVQATSFNSTDPEDEMWLVTPPIDLSTQKSLSFRTATAFWKHDGLTVMYSANFDGTNVASATWVPLTAVLANSTSGDNVWVDSGSISLPVAAKGYIGFRYIGNSAANTSTYRVDDVKVQ